MPRPEAAFEQIACFADVAFGRHEHEDIPGIRFDQRVFHGADGGLDVAKVARVLGGLRGREGFRGLVTDFHREQPPGHLHDRRTAESLGKSCRVDGSRGDDQVQIGPARKQQFREVAEQEVDVEGAFVRLVENEDRIGAQQRVRLDFRQQDAVGHELDAGIPAGVVAKANLAADLAAPLVTPSSSATRRETLSAATRRGWVQPMARNPGCS